MFVKFVAKLFGTATLSKGICLNNITDPIIVFATYVDVHTGKDGISIDTGKCVTIKMPLKMS